MAEHKILVNKTTINTYVPKCIMVSKNGSDFSQKSYMLVRRIEIKKAILALYIKKFQRS